MFEFEFDAPLFPFRYQSPAFEPLFQLPPTFRTQTANTAHAQADTPAHCFYIFNLVVMCYSQRGWLPLATP